MKKNSFLSYCLMLLGVGVLSQSALGEQRILSVNFSENTPVRSGTYANDFIGYGDCAVLGKQWMDCNFHGVGTSEPNQKVTPFTVKDQTDATDPYTNMEFFVCSRGGFWGAGTVTDGTTQMLNKFLDDNNTDSKYRAGLKLTNIPFPSYKLLVYFNRDGGGKIPAYQVNGSYYKGTEAGSAPATANDTWGDPNGKTTLIPGVNTLIVDNLTNSTLVVKASTVGGCRGCISGFQVVGDIATTSEYPIQATISADSAWSELTWTHPDGTPFEGPWEGTIPSVRLTVTGGNISEFPAVTIENLKIEGSAPFTLGTKGTIDPPFTVQTIDFTKHTGIATLGEGFASQNVIAGRDTVLDREGTGTLTVYGGMRATCNNFVWATDRTTNNGEVGISGGTADVPIEISVSGTDAKVGRYYICANSYFKCSVTDSSLGNKKYFINGAGADTSTVFLDSNCDWGMTDGAAIRNVKVIVGQGHTGQRSFWVERSNALDRSVVLDVQTEKLIVGTGFAIGGLAGSAEIESNTKNPAHMITANMINGQTSYSGKIGENLNITGTGTFTYTGPEITGTIAIGEGATFDCQTDTDNVFSSSKISGNGSLIKRGNLVLDANTQFTGSITVGAGTFKMVGPSGNPAVTINSGTTLQVGGMGTAVPLFRLQAVTGEALGKIPLAIRFTEADRAKAGWFQVARLDPQLPQDLFTIRVVSDFAATEELDGSLYKTRMNDNMLEIRAPAKEWSGNFDGNGTWSTSSVSKTWNNKRASFEDNDNVSFGDITDKNPVVTVEGTVKPAEILFENSISKYTLIPGTDALIDLAGPLSFGQGEAALGVPLKTPANANIDIKNGMTVTIGLFGPDVTATSETATYDQTLNLRPGGTLILAPGEGKKQLIKEVSKNSDATSNLVISNGMVAAAAGGDYASAGFFRNISPVIQAGGILLFDQLDISGYDTTGCPITIYTNGELRVEQRDTLRRGVLLKGGKITVSGQNSERGLDFFGNGMDIQVYTDSKIVGIPTDAEPNPRIGLRGDPIVFNVASGVCLENSVTYTSPAEGRKLRKAGLGTMVQNGVTNTATGKPYPFTYQGQTIVEAGTYELNCEHQNGNNAYLVLSGAQLTGTGAITGTGLVDIQDGAEISGGLTIGTITLGYNSKIGDSLTPVSATITNILSVRDLSQSPNVTIQNGTLTLGKNCVTKNGSAIRFALVNKGVLVLEAGVSLHLNTAPTFNGEETGIRIGIDYTGDQPTFPDFRINDTMDVANVTFSLKIEAGTFHSCKIPLLTAKAITGYENLSKAGLPAGQKWKYTVDANEDGTKTLYVEMQKSTLIILK